MIFEIILVLVGLFLYKVVFKTWSRMNWYDKTLTSLGYKVYKTPYSILGGKILKSFPYHFKKFGDAGYHFKREMCKYDVMVQNLWIKVSLILINADLIQEFYNPEKLDMFPKPLNQKTIFPMIIGRGILYSEGPKWKRKRKVMTELFDFNFIKSTIPDIIQTINKNFFEMEQSKNYPKIQLFEYMANIFGSITAKLFFGYNINSYKIEGTTLTHFLPKLFQQAFQAALNPEALLFGYQAMQLGHRKIFREVVRNNKLYREKLSEMIKDKTNSIKQLSAEERERNHSKDLISGILQYNEKCMNPQERYSDEELLNEISNLFFAGTDTTSHYLLMMIYYLGTYPQVRERAIAEVNKYIKSEKDITLDTLKNLKYLECIQKQTTRHFGPANNIFPRVVKEDTILKNVPIIKGTFINISIQPNHFNPKYFEDPLQFKPERWEEPDAYQNLHPYVYLGFSAGPRSCLGKSFALMESKIGLVLWLKRYRWEMEGEIKYNYHFLYSPEHQILTLSKIDPYD